MAIFYSGSLISGAFGNLIAAGILNGLNGAHGYSSWQWLYIIEGVLTVFVSHMKRPAVSTLGRFFWVDAGGDHWKRRRDANQAL